MVIIKKIKQEKDQPKSNEELGVQKLVKKGSKYKPGGQLSKAIK